MPGSTSTRPTGPPSTWWRAGVRFRDRVLAGLAEAGVMREPAVVACRYLLVAPEERYLAAEFGSEYAQYAASVRRWFGRVRGR